MSVKRNRKSTLTSVAENKEDSLVYQRKFEVRWDERVIVAKYTKKPLGIDVESGSDGIDLYVTSSNNPEAPMVKSGMLLVQINEYLVRGLTAPEIVKKIQLCTLPIQICFVYVDRKRTLSRGLSLRLRNRSTAVPQGLIRIYLPNGTPHSVDVRKNDLKTVVEMVCKKRGLVPEELVLFKQNRERENDVERPDLNQPALKWVEGFADKYRLRLIAKELASKYEKGVPVDGVSILTKNGFEDDDISELRKLMNALLHLPVDATAAALAKTVEDEYFDRKLTMEEIKAIVVWHKNIVKSEDNILQPPEQQYVRIYFEGGEMQHKTYNLKDPMTTAGDLCQLISADKKIQHPEKYALHIKGLSDVRAFEQELTPDDVPNLVKKAIVKSGVYGRLQFVYKELNVCESDSESDDDSSDDLVLAPTAKAFRVGSIDGWSTKDIDNLRKQMEERMEEMKLQEAEAETKIGEMDGDMKEQMELEEKRLELLKECVTNQYHLGEVIHDFEAASIKDFPAHKKLQDLRAGEVMIITDTDVSGWSRGKNINGGDEAFFPSSFVEVVAQPEMLVEVIHDFNKDNVSNLPESLVIIELTQGELILVTGTHISGWWRGCKVKGGPEGWFPGDYTMCIAAPAMDMSFRKIYGEPVLEGKLKLRIGVLKRFQAKYCWLTKEELVYFNTEGSDPQKPAGRIKLRLPNAKSIVEEKKNGKFAITIGRKTYECKVDESEVALWVKTLAGLFGDQ